ncbi:hypothetical protein FQA39_LY13080 [Lamprigera yunnana]|nr:hypothetical protein FQA39_LY13080 [Lamprigera yunnana]
MKFLIALFLLAARCCATPVNFCTSTNGITLNSIDINNCTSSTCVVIRDTNVTVPINATLNVAINTLKVKYVITYLPFPFFTINGEKDVTSIVGAPLPENYTMIYVYNKYVDNSYPVGNYDVMIQLINESNNVLLCFQFTITIQ